MPVERVMGGFRWGKHGKVYPTRSLAERQGRAILASQAAEAKKEETS